jgi:hypothetical protein
MKSKWKYKYKYKEPVEEYYHTSKYNLHIGNSTISNAGKGVFVDESIKSNTFIDYYYGDEISYIATGAYFVGFEDGGRILGIDALSFPRCYMAMVNDAYKTLFHNNCRLDIVDEQIEIWSIIDIFPGQELLMSYGSKYWNTLL